MEIRNSSNETPLDVARRFAELSCVQILGGCSDDASAYGDVDEDDAATDVEDHREESKGAAQGEDRGVSSLFSSSAFKMRLILL